MPGYILTVFYKFQHKPPECSQYAPHPWNKPVYGKYIQLATQQISAQKLNSAEKNNEKYTNGNFFYYAHEIYPTTLNALNKIYT